MKRKLVTLFDDNGPTTLKQISKEVTYPLSDDDKDLIKELIEYTSSNDGRGCSAIQLGEAKNIFVFEKPAGSKRLQVVINPSIKKMSIAKRDRVESCFSVPLPDRKSVLVRRPKEIVVNYSSLEEGLVEEQLNANTAQIFLHEFCHLKGFTILDDSPYGLCLGIR